MQSLKNLTISERVNNGALLLDSIVPNWYNGVNLETLRISSCERCVLGQLFGDFEDGRKKIELDRIQSAEFGFGCYSCFNQVYEYSEDIEIENLLLKQEWAKEIHIRQINELRKKEHILCEC